MKKVLFCIFLVLVTFILAFAACNVLDRYIPEAEAEEFQRVDLERDDLQLLDRNEGDGVQLRSVNATLPDDGVVGDNLILNSNFSRNSNGLSNYTLIGETVDDWYKLSSSGYLSVNDSPRSITLGADGTSKPYWRTTDPFVSLSGFTGYLTFSFYVSAISGTQFFCFLVGSSIQISNGFYVLPDSSPQIYSYTDSFEDYTGSLRFYFSAQSSGVGSMTVDWVKVEFGDHFTGYVPNIDEIESDSYNEGYDTGVSDVESYNNGSQSSVSYSFNFTDPAYRDISLITPGRIPFPDGYNLDWWLSGSGSVSFNNEFGLLLNNSTGTTSISQNVFEQIPSSPQYPNASRYYNFGFLLTKGFGNANDVSSVTITVGNEIHNLTVRPLSNVFVYYRCLVSDRNMVIKLNTANSHVYISKFKYEQADYFTGFLPSVLPTGSTEGIYNSGVQDGYRSGLKEGKAQGRLEGIEEGKDIGFESGKREGESIGYDKGFKYAQNLSETGNWRSFFSALIGVPVSYIRSFFDFEIFGFNFLSVFTSVITITLLFTVVKFVMSKL